MYEYNSTACGFCALDDIAHVATVLRGVTFDIYYDDNAFSSITLPSHTCHMTLSL